MKNILLIFILIAVVMPSAISQVVPSPQIRKYKKNISEYKTQLLQKTLMKSGGSRLISFNIDTEAYRLEKAEIDKNFMDSKGKIKALRDSALKQIKIDRQDPNKKADAINRLGKLRYTYGVQKDEIIKQKYDEYEQLYYTWEEDNAFRLFPARNRAFASLYYNSRGDKAIESLGNGFFEFSTGNADGASLYTELIAGYGSIFRFSFGGMLATSGRVSVNAANLAATPTSKIDSLLNSVDSINKVKNSIQRLIGGGGNAILAISTPLVDIHDYHDKFKLSVIAFDKISVDIPALGNTTNASLINGLGFEGNVEYALDSDNPFSFFVTIRNTFLNGTKDFYKNIGLEKSKTLSYSEILGGINIFSFKVYYNRNWVNDKRLNANFTNTIGVSVIPFKTKK